MATLYPPSAYPGNSNWMLPPLPLPPPPPLPQSKTSSRWTEEENKRFPPPPPLPQSKTSSRWTEEENKRFPPPPPPLPQSKTSSRWTEEENKRFESALALIDERRPDRWDKVAEMIPGKSVTDVINQYKELVADVSNIEAGLFPLPPPAASSFTLELMEHHRGFDSLRKRGRTSSSSSSSDQERKKGIPWTEEEHRRFLLGLQAHGKGDWRNISRNFVMSKTPTQVASHAQKYFLRQSSCGKDKKRPSIHDITTVHLPTTGTSCSNDDHHHHNKISSPSSENPSPSPAPAPAKLQFDWNDSNDELLMVFDSSHENESVPGLTGSLFDTDRGHGRGHYATNICTGNSKFQIQPTKYVHG